MYRILPLALFACLALAETPSTPHGQAVIRRKAGKSEIVITTTNRLAGAIHSLTFAQFEAVTGYMLPEFSKFWGFDPNTNKLQPLSDGPGEQTFAGDFGDR